MLYDVLNQVTLDARMGSFKVTAGKSGSERALLHEHRPRLASGDLLLLDRGYPSISLFFELQAQGVNFCVRMKTGWWNVVKEFKTDQNREHNQQRNKTNSIAKTRDILGGVFLKHDYQNALFSFDDIVYRTRELIRPGRKNPRKHRQKRPYPMNNKRL